MPWPIWIMLGVLTVIIIIAIVTCGGFDSDLEDMK